MTREAKIWTCKIGEVPSAALPDGADAPMRDAVARAYAAVTGEEPLFIFSGWGGELDESERAVVENREPSEDHRKQRHIRDAAPDLYEALTELIALHEGEATADGVVLRARAALARADGAGQ
ncbi:MAG: hypothetical protein KJZ75_11440 [Hyphomonadaceae bacterium]|nr:hypothetical protein [Hyphomonadaceae bacterium]